MTSVFETETREWLEHTAAGAALQDAWFRVPAAGCVARWSFRDLGTSLVDTVAGITLAPNATYNRVLAGAWRGVPCVVTTTYGFLEGWNEVLRHTGDITLEAIYMRRENESAGSMYNESHNLAICRGNYSSELLADNYIYAFGTGSNGSKVRWDAEHDAGIGESYEAGPAACADRPTMIQAVKEGLSLRLYSDGALVGATSLLYQPNGGTSIDQTLCVGGDKEQDGRPGSMYAELFSLGITLSARSHADVIGRYAASLGNLYA